MMVRVANFLSLRSFLNADGSLFTHGGNDSDDQFLAFVKISLDAISNFTIRQLDIVLGRAILINMSVRLE